MVLLSNTFLIFILLFLFIYYVCPKRLQWICLLVANCVFYAFSGIGNFAFIISSSLITFFSAFFVSSFDTQLKKQKPLVEKEVYKTLKHRTLIKKRFVLFISLFLNVGILVYLKYWRILVGAKTLLLPLGISYYTLQSISYFMDVYNGKIKRETNAARYFLFISFFPQLIMGPFNRYDKLGAQLREEHRFDFENIKHGVMLILYGAFKKYLIADMLYPIIESILDPYYEALPGCVILAGILSYSLYQYADFSGGTDMFLGIAELFGLRMQPNFRQPYFATSLGDFWRRWHISLGLWMKDYIFYPCALSKPMQNFGKWCQSHIGSHAARVLPACFANILVFMLVGVWHGPELHFFVWGLYNGLVIALSDLCKPVFQKLNGILHINDKSRAWHIFRIVRTFIIVNIGWYFDRITDVLKSFLYLRNTVLRFGNPLELLSKQYLSNIIGKVSNFESQIVCVVIGTVTVFVISLLKENTVDVYAKIQKQSIAVRWAAYYIPLILVILSFSFSSGDTGFMYAQY